MRRKCINGLIVAVAVALVAVPAAQAATAQRDGEQQWFKALMIRSQALDQKYGLAGPRHAVHAAVPADQQQWFKALMIRSHALDRKYGLGSTRPVVNPSSGGEGFNWGDASIGAGVALAAMLVLVSAVALSRRHRQGQLAG